MIKRKKKELTAEQLQAIRLHQGQWGYLVKKYKVSVRDIWDIKNNLPPYDYDWDHNSLSAEELIKKNYPLLHPRYPAK